MPIKLIAPLEKTFTLDRSDELLGNDGTPTTVTIRQARQAQHEVRSAVYSEVTRVLARTEDDGKMMLRQSWTMEELARTEVYLSMVDCNILGEDGKPLFNFSKKGDHQYLDMTTHAFREAWGQLQPQVAAEIHEKVMEVNLTWAGPLGM